MTPQKFRKKPVVIEAMQFTGQNGEAIVEWAGKSIREWDRTLICKTLEGTMYANKSDWIVKGIKGEFYPVRNDIFQATYESATGQQ